MTKLHRHFKLAETSVHTPAREATAGAALIAPVNGIIMGDCLDVMSGMAGEMAGPELGVTIAVVVIAALLAWLSHDADKKGWLS